MKRFISRLADYFVNRSESNQAEILKELKTMSAALDRLTQEVEEQKTVIASVVTLVEGLAQQIRDNITDQAALEALATTLDDSTKTLSDAVAANTPTPA